MSTLCAYENYLRDRYVLGNSVHYAAGSSSPKPKSYDRDGNEYTWSDEAGDYVRQVGGPGGGRTIRLSEVEKAEIEQPQNDSTQAVAATDNDKFRIKPAQFKSSRWFGGKNRTYRVPIDVSRIDSRGKQAIIDTSLNEAVSQLSLIGLRGGDVWHTPRFEFERNVYNTLSRNEELRNILHKKLDTLIDEAVKRNESKTTVGDASIALTARGLKDIFEKVDQYVPGDYSRRMWPGYDSALKKALSYNGESFDIKPLKTDGRRYFSVAESSIADPFYASFESAEIVPSKKADNPAPQTEQVDVDSGQHGSKKNTRNGNVDGVNLSSNEFGSRNSLYKVRYPSTRYGVDYTEGLLYDSVAGEAPTNDRIGLSDSDWKNLINLGVQTGVLDSKGKYTPLAQALASRNENARGIAWINLAYNNPTVKWFISNFDDKRPHKKSEIVGRLTESGVSPSKASAIFSSLKSYFSVPEDSPLLPRVGYVTSDGSLKYSGLQSIDDYPGVVVYAVSKALENGRSGRVRPLLTRGQVKAPISDDKTSVAPLGLLTVVRDLYDVEDVQKILSGFSIKHDDVLTTTFTHGNDQVDFKVPNNKVLERILGVRKRDDGTSNPEVPKGVATREPESITPSVVEKPQSQPATPESDTQFDASGLGLPGKNDGSLKPGVTENKDAAYFIRRDLEATPKPEVEEMTEETDEVSEAPSSEAPQRDDDATLERKAKEALGKGEPLRKKATRLRTKAKDAALKGRKEEAAELRKQADEIEAEARKYIDEATNAGVELKNRRAEALQQPVPETKEPVEKPEVSNSSTPEQRPEPVAETVQEQPAKPRPERWTPLKSKMNDDDKRVVENTRKRINYGLSELAWRLGNAKEKGDVQRVKQLVATAANHYLEQARRAYRSHGGTEALAAFDEALGGNSLTVGQLRDRVVDKFRKIAQMEANDLFKFAGERLDEFESFAETDREPIANKEIYLNSIRDKNGDWEELDNKDSEVVVEDGKPTTLFPDEYFGRRMGSERGLADAVRRALKSMTRKGEYRDSFENGAEYAVPKYNIGTSTRMGRFLAHGYKDSLDGMPVSRDDYSEQRYQELLKKFPTDRESRRLNNLFNSNNREVNKLIKENEDEYKKSENKSKVVQRVVDGIRDLLSRRRQNGSVEAPSSESLRNGATGEVLEAGGADRPSDGGDGRNLASVIAEASGNAKSTTSNKSLEETSESHTRSKEKEKVVRGKPISSWVDDSVNISRNFVDYSIATPNEIAQALAHNGRALYEVTDGDLDALRLYIEKLGFPTKPEWNTERKLLNGLKKSFLAPIPEEARSTYVRGKALGPSSNTRRGETRRSALPPNNKSVQHLVAEEAKKSDIPESRVREELSSPTDKGSEKTNSSSASSPEGMSDMERELEEMRKLGYLEVPSTTQGRKRNSTPNAAAKNTNISEPSQISSRNNKTEPHASSGQEPLVSEGQKTSGEQAPVAKNKRGRPRIVRPSSTAQVSGNNEKIAREAEMSEVSKEQVQKRIAEALNSSSAQPEVAHRSMQTGSQGVQEKASPLSSRRYKDVELNMSEEDLRSDAFENYFDNLIDKARRSFPYTSYEDVGIITNWIRHDDWGRGDSSKDRRMLRRVSKRLHKAGGDKGIAGYAEVLGLKLEEGKPPVESFVTELMNNKESIKQKAKTDRIVDEYAQRKLLRLQKDHEERTERQQERQALGTLPRLYRSAYEIARQFLLYGPDMLPERKISSVPEIADSLYYSDGVDGIKALARFFGVNISPELTKREDVTRDFVNKVAKSDAFLNNRPLSAVDMQKELSLKTDMFDHEQNSGDAKDSGARNRIAEALGQTAKPETNANPETSAKQGRKKRFSPDYINEDVEKAVQIRDADRRKLSLESIEYMMWLAQNISDKYGKTGLKNFMRRIDVTPTGTTSRKLLGELREHLEAVSASRYNAMTINKMAGYQR
jgi:hypothetical protein